MVAFNHVEPTLPKPLATAWEHYRAKVIPANACEVQIVETRRAFYAGALTVYCANKYTVADKVSFGAELEQFNKDVLAGKA